jgi:phosphate uptake regulator
MNDDLGYTLRSMANAVANQVRQATDLFLARDLARLPRLIEKDGYVDQLNALVDQRTFRELTRQKIDPRAARYFRGVIRIAINLEKIGDYAANIGRQTRHLHAAADPDLGRRFHALAAKVEKAVKVAVDAFLQGDWELATHVAEVEHYLDGEYARCFPDAQELLRSGKIDAGDMITTIFVAKYLEKMGDSLQNIAEVCLSMTAGESLKVHQVDHLRHVAGGGKVVFRRAAGGISGAFTGIVENPDGTRFFYKEGSYRVIQEELSRARQWNDLLPGIVPAVHGGIFDENSEGYLMDYLEGRLFQDLYLDDDWAAKEKATRRLLETMASVWDRTLTPEPPKADYARQIARRAAELFATHPEIQALATTPLRVGRITRRSPAAMLTEARKREAEVAPPFSVFVHGDFNGDNVFYEPAAERIHFIDVHRSGPGDYAADLGTFIVSNLRHPLVTEAVRGDLYRINRIVFDFGRAFAARHGDTAFEKRIELVLARNYLTSGRLYPDLDHAQDLFLRGVYCLERFLGAEAAA